MTLRWCIFALDEIIRIIFFTLSIRICRQGEKINRPLRQLLRYAAPGWATSRK